MTLTTAKTTPSQVDTLAKLYLEGKPAEIADETIAQLCNWLMDEFYQWLCCKNWSRSGRYT